MSANTNLLATETATQEFNLAAKRSYFHVIADRWCARGGTAREAGRHNRPLVYGVDRCRRSAFVGKGLARSQAKLPRGGRTTEVIGEFGSEKGGAHGA